MAERETARSQQRREARSQQRGQEVPVDHVCAREVVQREWDAALVHMRFVCEL